MQFFIAAKTCLLLLTLGDVNYCRAVALKPLQLSAKMSFVKKIDCFFSSMPKTFKNYVFHVFICIKRKNAHRKRKTFPQTQKINGLHAILVLERKRRAVSFSQTIHSKQINKASNTFRMAKSARVKK